MSNKLNKVGRVCPEDRVVQTGSIRFQLITVWLSFAWEGQNELSTPLGRDKGRDSIHFEAMSAQRHVTKGFAATERDTTGLPGTKEGPNASEVGSGKGMLASGTRSSFISGN